MKHLSYLILFILLHSCSKLTPQHLYDKDIILLSDQTAPNKKHRLLEYHVDHGALGYSRIFWAIIPTNTDTTEMDLTDYILPNGYKALKWNTSGEAVLKKWQPYYYNGKKLKVLTTGDKYLGVKVVIQ